VAGSLCLRTELSRFSDLLRRADEQAARSCLRFTSPAPAASRTSARQDIRRRGGPMHPTTRAAISGLPGAPRIPRFAAFFVKTHTRAARPQKNNAHHHTSSTGMNRYRLDRYVAGLLEARMAKVYKIWNEKTRVFRAGRISCPLRPNSKAVLDRAKITASCTTRISSKFTAWERARLPYLEWRQKRMLLEALMHRWANFRCCMQPIAILVARALEYPTTRSFLSTERHITA
jgi:hypothetical protein